MSIIMIFLTEFGVPVIDSKAASSGGSGSDGFRL